MAPPQALGVFYNEVNTLASLQHPNFCKLIGFLAHEGSDQRMLVYGRLFCGSLKQFLYERSEALLSIGMPKLKLLYVLVKVSVSYRGSFQALANLPVEALERRLLIPQEQCLDFRVSMCFLN